MNLLSIMTRKQTRETRDRLNGYLAELNQIRPIALLREDGLGRELGFRADLPCFERTLELFHRISRYEIGHVPPIFIKKIADDAARSLDQFRRILALRAENQNVQNERDLLVAEVKDSLKHISTDLALVVSNRPKKRRPARYAAALALGFGIFIIALAIVAYFSIRDGMVADQILSTIRRIGIS